MNFVLDVHCHTVSSTHAYSTITENAAHAASIGLTHIGIADHGPNMPGGAHRYHFSNLVALPAEIHGVQILRGIEANILDSSGSLDLSDTILAKLDFVIASMHRDVIAPASRSENTQALVNAMKNPRVHILGHPHNSQYPMDAEAVVKVAAQTGTIIEINNHSLKPGSFRYNGTESFIETLALCKQHNVSILASSDAHYHTSVGDFFYAKPLIEEFGFPEELVVNTSIERFRAALKNAI